MGILENGKRLSGTIPLNFSRLPSLRDVKLGETALSGTLSSSLSRPSGFRYLDISYSEISGTLPSVSQIPIPLVVRKFMANRLSGHIPPTIWTSNLDTLSIYGNAFSGTLPSDAASFAGNIKTMLLNSEGTSYNRLSGTLPSNWPKTNKLKVLDIRMMSVSGTLSESMSRLSSLKYFIGPSNRLSGTIPSALNWPHSQKINLGLNRLSGTLPSQVSHL